jgi:hypothetical protein
MADQPKATPQQLPQYALETTPAHPGLARMQLGMVPASLDEGWRLAQLMARSEIVPKAFQKKPEDVLVAIQLGMEVGLAPMQSLQSIAVINGKPTLYGDGFLALIMASPSYVDHDEYYEVGGKRKGRSEAGEWVDEQPTVEELALNETAGVCTFHRRGKGQPVTRRFSIGDARRAKTVTYDGAGNKRTVPLIEKPGPWVEYPARMLAMRARSWAGRDCFPDVLRGIQTREEALDQEPEAPPESPVQRSRTRQAEARRAAQQAVDVKPLREAIQEMAAGVDPGPQAPATAADKPAPAPPLNNRQGAGFVPVDITENLEPLPPDAPADAPVDQAPPALMVTNILPVIAQGKTYYLVTFSDGITAHTWSTTIVDVARGALRVGASVKPTYEETTFRRAPLAIKTLEVL